MIHLILSLSMLFSAAQEKPPQQQQQDQSLADLAKQTKERRSGAPPARMITNADLKALENARVTTNTSTEKTVTPAGEKLEPAEGEVPVDEQELQGLIAEFKPLFEEARLRLQKAVNEGLVLQLRMTKLNDMLLSASDGSTQGRYQGLIEQTFQQIQANQKEQEDARAALNDLQKDAGKAGLPPKAVQDLTGEIPRPSVQVFPGPDEVPRH